MLIKINCLNCGTLKEVNEAEHSKTSRKGKNVGRFCSSKCSGAYETAHTPELEPNTSCTYCKTPLYRNAYRSKKWKVFCSRTCKDKGGAHGPPRSVRIKIPCGFCKIEFEVVPSDSWRKCCSRTCSGQLKRLAQKKALSPFKTTNTKRFYSSTAWKELRIKAFERDAYTCVDCSQKGGYLEVNHIKPRSLHPEHKLELTNLETLCKPCHDKKKWMVYK